METKELTTALEGLKNDLSGKTAIEVKTAIDSFKVENKTIIEAAVKEAQDALQLKLDGLQSDYNKLDVKLQGKVVKQSGKVDDIKALITDNFDQIAKSADGEKVKIHKKDMTLATGLVGDQPRDYSNVVAMVPRQLINLADLMASVSISGGTYTFPRETSKTGTVTTQVEGDDKATNDYVLTMVDVNTDFIAGYTTYSRKMANNLPFLETFLPDALRRDYWKGENSIFNTALAALVTASVLTAGNNIERLIAEVATLEGLNYSANGIVVTPADFYDILVTEKSEGAGYGLPGVVTFEAGQLRINGIPLFKATWLAADKYYVGDFTQCRKVVTEGLGVEFSEQSGDNFVKNNITARVEAQVGLAVHRPDAIIYGDFTTVTANGATTQAKKAKK